MAVEFLTEEQKKQYGRFTEDPSDVELAKYFHLDKTDMDLIKQRRGDHNRLGFALLLTSVRYLGTFVDDVILDVPVNVHVFVARQLSISDLSCLDQYASRENTRWEHTATIKRYFGYIDFGEHPATFRLIRLIYTRAWLSNERHGLLFDFAAAWLIQNKVLLPGQTTLSRLISEIKERCDRRLWKKLSVLPNKDEKQEMQKLFDLLPGTRTSYFDFYRKGPVRVSGITFNKAVKRYLFFKGFNTSRYDLSKIPPVRFKTLARYASLTSMHKIMRMPDDRQTAMLVAYVISFTTIALDDVLDVFDLLLADINKQAKLNGIKTRIRTLKDLDKSALYLASIAEQLLKDHTDIQALEQLVASDSARKRLQISVDTVNQLAKPQYHNYQDEVIEQYSRVKSILKNLFEHIYFHHTPVGSIVTDSLAYLKINWPERRKYLIDAPLEIVTPPWEQHVFDEEGRIVKKGYVLCSLNRLQDALKRRDVFVKESDRWSDPRTKLLQGKQWEVNRASICRSLGHPIKPDLAIKQLTQQLDSSYQKVSANFDDNDAVSIDYSGRQPSLTISNLEKLDEPDSLITLRKEVMKLMPKVDLTELLMEVNQITGFAEEFTHVSESMSRVDDLSLSICALLTAEACNIGIDPLIKPQKPALTKHRLDWIKQNYYRIETLSASNAKLVDFHETLWLPDCWGGGEVAAADGMRLVTPVQTIHSGPNRKFFGPERGITWYNFMTDQFAGFFGVVIPGTKKDSMYLLQGVLEQQTSLKPKEIMTDTAGSSYLIHGLFWLLGYQFSPRMADAGECKFWRIDKQADYGVLNELARGQIKVEKAYDVWDEMLRTAGSLKMCTVSAPELVQSLLRSDKPNSLAQGIIEIGKVAATLNLLLYVDDEDHRRRVLTQLNRIESRHGLARKICHGDHGEIRKKYKEGQEDQLGALGLVLNSVVLWNTIYMQEAIEYLRKNTDIEVKDEDIARLSPLIWAHINMLGRYSFNLSEEVLAGALRALNIDFEDGVVVP